MSRVNIPNGSITTVRLANDAVVSSKIKEGAVKTEQLADGAVTNAKISLVTPVKTSNDTTPATTAYVKTLIDDLVDSAPSALDTLNEIASALGDDSNLGAGLTASITAISAAVSSETSARISAVSAEAAARESADSVISAAVSAEAAARESAISTAVSAEAVARDSAISTAVSEIVRNYIQFGGDIDGESNGDYSGYSVSLSADGSIVAIGAHFNSAGGSYRGHVRVYAWNGTSWVQRGDDIDGEANNDLSGTSVSLSADGSIIAIGAPYNDSNGYHSGHVRVYAWNDSIWVQRGADIDGVAYSNNSGHSVSLSADGSIIAIGAPYNDGNGINSGHVRVYQYDETKITAQMDDSLSNFGPIGWNRLGNDINGEAADDSSGWSVSISTDGYIVAIGALYNTSYRGHVRVYAWNGTSWVQRGADIDGEAIGDVSGWSVSLSADGSIIAIGAHRNRNYAGHVRVYQYDATKITAQIDDSLSNFGPIGWNRLGNDIDGDSDSGWSVSLSADGSIVAIGAVGYANYTGRVRVYAWNGSSSSWVQRGTDIVGEAVADECGCSVSISADGSIVAVGSRYNAGGGSYRGHVRVHEYTNEVAITRDSAISAAVSAEAVARDSAISAAVSAEAAALESAISTAVSAEAVARATAISTAVSAEVIDRNNAISSAISGMSTGMTSESVNSAISSESDALKNIIDSLVGSLAPATNLGVTSIEYTQNDNVNNPFKYLVNLSYDTKNLGNYYYNVYYALASTPSAKTFVGSFNITNYMYARIYPLEPGTNYIFSVILLNIARDRLIDNSEVTLEYTTPSAP